MTETVDALRDEIRLAVGRYERIESTAFTKEALAAIRDAVSDDVDPDDPPSKSKTRTEILRAIGERDDGAGEGIDRPFRKAELEAVAAALRDE